MNGILYWKKRWLGNCFWNESTGGGNLYYRIPYIMNPGCRLTNELLNDIAKIVQKLFRKNPDYDHCDIVMSVLGNKVGTTDQYVTACVVTHKKEFYEKYAYGNRVPGT